MDETSAELVRVARALVIAAHDYLLVTAHARVDEEKRKSLNYAKRDMAAALYALNAAPVIARQRASRTSQRRSGRRLSILRRGDRGKSRSTAPRI